MPVGEMVWLSDCGLGYRIPRRVLPCSILNPYEAAHMGDVGGGRVPRTVPAIVAGQILQCESPTCAVAASM